MKADLMDLAIMQDDSDNEGDFYSKRVIDDKDLKHILKLRPERRLKD